MITNCVILQVQRHQVTHQIFKYQCQSIGCMNSVMESDNIGMFQVF